MANKTEQQTLQKQTHGPRVIPDVLYDFSRAVYGNYCRTSCMILFNGVSGSLSWLEAHQDRQGSWTLYKRYKDIDADTTPVDAAATGNPLLKTTTAFEQIVLEKDLGLMEVLGRMASFEYNITDTPAGIDTTGILQGHDAAALGALHYKSFGIRECVAFDAVTGAPAPSFEGRISGQGSFTEDMEQSIAGAWNAKVNTFATEGSYLDALILNAKPSAMIQHIYEHLNRAKAYTELLAYFEENIFEAFKICQEKGFDHHVMVEGGGVSASIPAGDALEQIIQQTLNNNDIQESYKQSLSDEDFQNIRNALISLDIFRCVLHARWAMEIAHDHLDLVEESDAFVREQIVVIQGKYADFGLESPDRELISAAIMDKDSEQAIDINKSIARIRADLTDLRDNAAQTAKSYQKAKPRGLGMNNGHSKGGAA